MSKAPENFRKRRVLEAYFIKTICPTLNEQLDNDILTLLHSSETVSLRHNFNCPLAIFIYYSFAKFCSNKDFQFYL